MQVNEDKYREALATLKVALEQSRASGDVTRKDAERSEVYARYRSRFVRSGLDALDAETFQSFLRFENNRHWTGINRQSTQLVRDMPLLRKALATLLEDTRDLGERLRDGCGLVKGLRMAVATAFMHVAEPEKYGVWNATARDAVRSHGIWPDPATNDDVASYPAGNELLLRLSRDLGIDLWTLDWLWYAVSQADSPAGSGGPTPTYLFTWNPANWEWTQETIAGLVAKLEAGEAVTNTWSTGRSTQPTTGDRFYLIRLGEGPRGIFASGKVMSAVKEGPRWNRDRAAAGDTYRYVQVRFDELLNPWTDPLLLQSELVETFPNVEWSPQASGTRISPEVLFPLEEAWQRHLASTTDRSLAVVQSVADVQENIRSFAQAVSARHPAAHDTARQRKLFVCDASRTEFAPYEWSGFRGMTIETYRALERMREAASEKRGFEWRRARKQLEQVVGAVFKADPTCQIAIRSQLEAAYGQATFGGRTLEDSEFMCLPAEVAQPKESGMAEPERSIHDPQNVIYYGPPGTGKTYRVIEEAVRLCDGTAPSSRGEIQARFRRLQSEGRIELVTFHQSYSYEEFVEGIRPVMAAGDARGAGEIEYEVREGTFKRLCRAASGRTVRAAEAGGIDVRSTRVWKMSLADSRRPGDDSLYDECIAKSRIALGYGGDVDYSGAATREAVRERAAGGAVDAADDAYAVTAVHSFWNEMKAGDLVVVPDRVSGVRAVAQVTGDATVAQDAAQAGMAAQVRPVKWLVRFDPSLPSERVLKRRLIPMTLYRLGSETLRTDELERLLRPGHESPGQPHVLVIDEINRGNVAKILGELITLLEPDKRLGAPNELVVRLPYSGDEFGVPGNLHVLGTMNTADRSIAFLDAALRRRFRFVEILPDAQVVRDQVGVKGVLDGVDVAALLETLNRRIEALYDRDHTLGHSYFLGCRTLSDLRDAFVDRVIPLLKEYFYDDWPKACSVLGCVYDTDSGPIKKPHAHPMILARDLSSEALPDGGQDLDGRRVQYTVSDAFLKADVPELRAYFEAVIGGK